MGGGLLQLVAYGAQDAYLSGNPQITFWKALFKRHMNFAMEPFRVNFTGQAAWGGKNSAIIGRHADLLYTTYLEVVLPAGIYNNTQGRLGYNLLEYAELNIGGTAIDRLYGEWLYLWDSLTSDLSKSTKLWKMVGSGLPEGEQTYTDPNATCASGRSVLPNVVYVPLTFFYTRNAGAALPLIALAYHEVRIDILWNTADSVSGNLNTNPAPTKPISAAIYADYIYLDVEERRRMAQESHEYLIEQVQYNEDKGITSYNNRIDLTFNHPVKELVWVVQPSDYTNCKLAATNSRPATRLTPFTYDVAAVESQFIQMNGQDRLEKRYGDYFNQPQMYQHHTGFGATVKAATIPAAQPGIYMYSFALKPEEHQPSGSCNFSRIDTATIVINIDGNTTINNNYGNWDVRV